MSAAPRTPDSLPAAVADDSGGCQKGNSKTPPETPVNGNAASRGNVASGCSGRADRGGGEGSRSERSLGAFAVVPGPAGAAAGVARETGERNVRKRKRGEGDGGILHEAEGNEEETEDAARNTAPNKADGCSPLAEGDRSPPSNGGAELPRERSPNREVQSRGVDLCSPTSCHAGPSMSSEECAARVGVSGAETTEKLSLVALPPIADLPSGDARCEGGAPDGGGVADRVSALAGINPASARNDGGTEMTHPAVATAVDVAEESAPGSTMRCSLGEVKPLRQAATVDAAATPNACCRRGGGASSRREGSIEKPYFTDGVAEIGRTNWAAGVCGRGELFSYRGEEADGLIAVDTGAAAARHPSLEMGQKELPAHECAPPDPDKTRRGGATRDGGASGRRPVHKALSRRSHQVEKKLQARRASSAQQLAFSSEDDSGGGGGPADAVLGSAVQSGAAAELVPGLLSLWESPRRGQQRVVPSTASTEIGRGCGANPPAAATEGKNEPELPVPAAAATEVSGKGGEAGTAAGGGGCAAMALPPRSPAAASAAAVFAGGTSPLVLSLEAKQAAEEDRTGDGALAECRVKPVDGLVRRCTAVENRPPRAPPPPPGGEVGAEVVATAAVTAVPSRPSAGGWFSSRRRMGLENPPLSPAAGDAGSQTSVGTGCTPTPSPDLLAVRTGKGKRTISAAAGTAAAAVATKQCRRGRGDSAASSSGFGSAACGRRASLGAAIDRVGVVSTAGPLRRSTTAPPHRSSILLDVGSNGAAAASGSGRIGSERVWRGGRSEGGAREGTGGPEGAASEFVPNKRGGEFGYRGSRGDAGGWVIGCSNRRRRRAYVGAQVAGQGVWRSRRSLVVLTS